MCFKNLVGNENNKYILKETITKGNILHSYMFFGNEGIGKKIFALEFAKMILCENQKIHLVKNVSPVLNLIRIIILISFLLNLMEIQ